MDEIMQDVTAIVPCYNESPRIGSVLLALTRSKFIKEVIVVDDGSTDNTQEIVKKFQRVKFIRLKKNFGKADAVRAGSKLVKTPVTLLVDADLEGLKEKHIKQLLFPVFSGNFDACIGILYRHSPVFQWMKHHIFPIVSGQRAVKTEILREALSNPVAKKYWLEVAMNHYFKTKKLKVMSIDLHGVSHTNKLLKWGWKKFLKYMFTEYVALFYFRRLAIRLKNIFWRSKVPSAARILRVFPLIFY